MCGRESCASALEQSAKPVDLISVCTGEGSFGSVVSSTVAKQAVPLGSPENQQGHSPRGQLTFSSPAFALVDASELIHNINRRAPIGSHVHNIG